MNILDQIRQERINGELLGPLVDKYVAENVVAALGIAHVAGSLGVVSERDVCPSCGIDFAEFPEMRHDQDECDGPECTCYEVIDGHQPGCAYHRK